MKCDFSGYATRNDLRCADGRVIRRDAFKDCDGKKVPLVWNHEHNDPGLVLGHSILENREDGVYSYNFFNDTESGRAAKTIVEHGDVFGLSIYANHLKQKGSDVMHGIIREVSLVLAGANPGAYIDAVLAHSEEEGEAAYISFIEDEAAEALAHSACDLPDTLIHSDKEEEKVADEKKEPEAKKEDGEETVADVFNTLTEKQKTVVYALIGQALEGNGSDDDDDEEDSNVKHNVFDNDERNTSGVICHADQEMIMAAAKKGGSFRDALETYVENNSLQHADGDPAAASGFGSYPSGDDPAAIDALFPEWHDVRPGAPELVTDDLAWVQTVLRGANKSPFSRIRTGQVDIRNIDELRAKGYVKGTEKALAGNYSLVRRTTDPQTIYVKSALNRDDIVDITDFDYVAYQYKIDRMQLEEEVATAILIGDGRQDGAEGKIEETHVRPIWTDDDLYTIHVDIAPYMADINGQFSDNFGENYKYSEGMIAAMLDAMIDYRGSGSMVMFCTPQFINKMLLARDLNGRRLYSSKSELATALNVNAIYPVSKLAGKTRTKGTGADAKEMDLVAIAVNLRDYSVGSTKGGEITHFNQFDIDFNQEKSLLETRMSGANTRIYSAIVFEEEANPSQA